LITVSQVFHLYAIRGEGPKLGI